jgi:hypothetical protein
MEKTQNSCEVKQCRFIPIVAAICVAVGPALGGYFIGKSLKRNNDDVTVKGLSEREVKADLAIWTISFKETMSELAPLEKKIQTQKKMVLEFLEKHGLQAEITNQSIDVNTLREYIQQKETHVVNYEATGNITIRTSKVDEAKEISEKTSELIRQGVAISSTMSYKYTKFNDLREKMLAEAAQSARRAADQFATNSKVEVGSIKTAHQGSFTILGADNASSSEYDYREETSLKKRIRVVSTVTFHLKS